jgi:hypothetical protein
MDKPQWSENRHELTGEDRDKAKSEVEDLISGWFARLSPEDAIAWVEAYEQDLQRKAEELEREAEDLER